MTDASRLRLVRGQPGDGPDRPGNEEEAVAQFRRATRNGTGHQHGDRHRGEVVIGQRGMTAVAREQNLVRPPSRDHHFAIGEASRGQRAVDAHLVAVIGKGLQHPVRQAESPALPVVARPIGNPVRLIGQGVQVRAKLREGHGGPDRHAVAHHVQGMLTEVDDPLAARILHVGIADVPFPRHRPVEHRRAARHFGEHQGRDALQAPEAFPHPVTGDAAAEREQFRHQGMRFDAERGQFGGRHDDTP